MGRFILFSIIFYFVWRFLDSFFRTNRQTAPNAPRAERKQKVTVNYDRKKSRSKVGKNVGEYVDFEEVDVKD